MMSLILQVPEKRVLAAFTVECLQLFSDACIFESLKEESVTLKNAFCFVGAADFFHSVYNWKIE